MVEEAKLTALDGGRAPNRDGWFVVNARDARWHANAVFGRYTAFEGDTRFEQYGIGIHVLDPGEPNCMYHGEDAQEDFLVLSGECLLLVEGQERRLRAWDFVHCPPWTEHIFVGAGDGPCAILMVGRRRPGIEVRYPALELAQRHGAGVPVETPSPDEAYAPFPAWGPAAYRDGDLG